MMSWFAALQPLLIGGILVWAGAFKLLSSSAPMVAARSALPAIVGKELALPAYRFVGCAELVVAALLLLPPAHPVDTLAATGLCLGFVGFLTYARIAAPDSSCGCLSARPTKVGWRSLARAAAMAGLSALAMTTAQAWTTAVGENPLTATGLLLAEAVVMLALSPDLDSAWLLPLRRLRLRWRHPLAGKAFEVPVESSVQQLQRSDTYRAVGGLLRSDLRESWDEGEWRILSYTASYGDRAATAVFAVPRLRYQPEDIRAVLVDEADQSVLLQVPQRELAGSVPKT